MCGISLAATALSAWGSRRAAHVGAHKDLAGVAKAQRQPGVGDEVRQAVVAAEQARLAVVGEPLLSALDGGRQGQRGRARGVVLCAATSRQRPGPMFYSWKARLCAGPARTCFSRFCSELISFFWRFAKPLLSLHGVSPAMSA